MTGGSGRIAKKKLLVNKNHHTYRQLEKKMEVRSRKPEFLPDSKWFLSVETIETPKPIYSLIYIWEYLSKKQISKCTKNEGENIAQRVIELLNIIKRAQEENESGNNNRQYISEIETFLDSLLSSKDKLQTGYKILHCVVRALHIKIHLTNLEKESRRSLLPRRQIYIPDDDNILHTRLILQCFLSFLQYEYYHNCDCNLEKTFQNFEQFVHRCVLRLVSTVHPNETERSVNLMHYTRILDLYVQWNREWMSLQGLPLNAPEYRIRREQLNQMRRQIKGEIEAIWQSDQIRIRPITVTSEARRLIDRYKIIFQAFPFHQKFTKQLIKEAYWLFNASLQVENKEWCEKFNELWGTLTNASRVDRIATIKRTFKELHMEHQLPPRPSLQKPTITFSTWRGGDRDGNPFVTASFTNQTFVKQKLFVLNYFVEFVKSLVDKITPSSNNVNISQELVDSVKADSKKFPFIDTIKFNEPYRAKLRYILEKLTNTQHRTAEVCDKAGEITKPLLSLTLPGPSGYSSISELQEDLQVIYSSLILNDGKSQARSQIQELKILVDTFGFHMCSVDFRQVSTQNAATVHEFLIVSENPYGLLLKECKEEHERRKMLLKLIESSELEFDPSCLSQMSKIARDTFQTLLIFADAARTDQNMVGKFIISMCKDVSDILNVLLLLKLSGMLTFDSSSNEIICKQDVTGLYETIEDLKNAPRIIEELLAIPTIKKYIVNHREKRISVMLGYSDSVRDGSALCSDAQIARACIELHKLEERINSNCQINERIEIIFYRGRGDSLSRGYGGDIKKAIASQTYTTNREDHTEQNRYLRRYTTISSALDHFHSIYSAHLSAVVNQITQKGPINTNPIYQTLFEICGHLSNDKWLNLVKGDRNGEVYFSILSKYTILPILPGCQFASRPVCRSGVSYNIDNIRAIPFTMDLAQMREFTVAYYGCGSAFDKASILFKQENRKSVLLILLEMLNKEDRLTEDLKRLVATFTVNPNDSIQNIISAIRQRYAVYETEVIGAEILKAISVFYPDNIHCAHDVAKVMLHMMEHKKEFLDLINEMYKNYAPFRYSIDNKLHALFIREKRIVDEYTKGATQEEQRVLTDTEEEAQKTKNWLLKIVDANKFSQKQIHRNYGSIELLVLHKIQSRMLEGYNTYVQEGKQMHRKELSDLSVYLQMTILAISEALGFGG